MNPQQIEQLELIISANADAFRSELADVKSRLNNFESSIGGVTKSMTGSFTKGMIAGQLAINVLSKSISAVTNGVKGMVVKLAQSGGEMVRLKDITNVVTRNMGMTTSEVNDLRNSLAEITTFGVEAESVIKTLAQSGLVEMAKGLKNVNARTGEVTTGVNALVLAMKDLAIAGGVTTDEGLIRITKFIRRGTSSFVDGIIEIGNMNMAYKEYAESIGKTSMQLTEQERAMARMNIVMREGEKVYGSWATAFQTSAKSFENIRSVTRNLYQYLGSYLEPVFASIGNTVYQLFFGLRQALIENASMFRDWAVKVAGYIVAVMKILGGLLSRIPKIGKHFQGLRDFAFKPITLAMNELGNATGGVSDSMDSATGSAKALKKELLGLAGFDEMNVLRQQEEGGSSIGGVGGIGLGGLDFGEMMNIDELNENLEKINEYSEKFEKKIRDMIKRVREFFEPIVGLWREYAKPAFEAMSLKLKELFDLLGINTEGTETWGYVFKIVAGAIVILIGSITWAVTGLISMWVEVVRIFRWVMDMGKLYIGAFTSYFKGDMEAIGNYARQIFNMLPNWLQNALVGATYYIGTFVVGAVSYFREFQAGATYYINAIVVGAVSYFEELRNKIRNVIENIKSLFKGLNLSLVDFGNMVIVSIKDTLNSAILKINKIFDTYRGIKIPIIAPSGLNIPRIPYLAQGGVIDSPTIAMLGESGREAVVPLENNTEWIDKLAEKIGGNEPIHLTVNVGDEKIAERVINWANDRSMRTGDLTFNI